MIRHRVHPTTCALSCPASYPARMCMLLCNLHDNTLLHLHEPLQCSTMLVCS